MFISCVYYNPNPPNHPPNQTTSLLVLLSAAVNMIYIYVNCLTISSRALDCQGRESAISPLIWSFSLLAGISIMQIVLSTQVSLPPRTSDRGA